MKMKYALLMIFLVFNTGCMSSEKLDFNTTDPEKINENLAKVKGNEEYLDDIMNLIETYEYENFPFDKYGRISRQVYQALVEFSDETLIAELEKIMKNEDDRVRQRTISILCTFIYPEMPQYPEDYRFTKERYEKLRPYLKDKAYNVKGIVASYIARGIKEVDYDKYFIDDLYRLHKIPEYMKGTVLIFWQLLRAAEHNERIVSRRFFELMDDAILNAEDCKPGQRLSENFILDILFDVDFYTEEGVYSYDDCEQHARIWNNYRTWYLTHRPYIYYDEENNRILVDYKTKEAGKHYTTKGINFQNIGKGDASIK